MQSWWRTVRAVVSVVTVISTVLGMVPLAPLSVVRAAGVEEKASGEIQGFNPTKKTSNTRKDIEGEVYVLIYLNIYKNLLLNKEMLKS